MCKSYAVRDTLGGSADADGQAIIGAGAGLGRSGTGDAGSGERDGDGIDSQSRKGAALKVAGRCAARRRNRGAAHRRDRPLRCAPASDPRQLDPAFFGAAGRRHRHRLGSRQRGARVAALALGSTQLAYDGRSVTFYNPKNHAAYRLALPSHKGDTSSTSSGTRRRRWPISAGCSPASARTRCSRERSRATWPDGRPTRCKCDRATLGPGGLAGPGLGCSTRRAAALRHHAARLEHASA